MEIPNLTQTNLSVPEQSSKISVPLILVLILLAVTLGYIVSRLNKNPSSSIKDGNTKSLPTPLSADTITDKSSIKVGQIYGDTAKIFADTTSGTIEKGVIGEGTHILNRDGGLSQRASLTSSVIDLDLFVGRKVEIKGETNRSNKAAWLLDVGWLKVQE